MKKILNNLLFMACSLMLLAACSDEDHTQTKPVWEVDSSINYSATMTAIVVLPDNLQEYAQDSDLLAVFLGEECRGKGTLVKKESKNYYFLTVKGHSGETGKLTFMYYNTTRSYLFSTGAILDFQPDGTWGVIDNPRVLNLNLVN